MFYYALLYQPLGNPAILYGVYSSLARAMTFAELTEPYKTTLQDRKWRQCNPPEKVVVELSDGLNTMSIIRVEIDV